MSETPTSIEENENFTNDYMKSAAGVCTPSKPRAKYRVQLETQTVRKKEGDYMKTASYIFKVCSPDGHKFDMVVDILQGDTLVPYLFIICQDYVPRTR